MNRPFVLIPLYIYPLEKAWEPLFQIAEAHPEVLFVAIINPNSGPGQTSLPDASYVAALRRMRKIPNIHTLGYVHCSYGHRPVDAIKAEIDVYRGWKGCLELGGIFFDETPSDAHYVRFMATLADHTRSTWQRDLGRYGRVIYNPGVVVGHKYFDYPDYVVVFEQSHDHWNRIFAEQELRYASAEARAKSVAIIHSSPAKGSMVEALTRQIRSLGVTGIFVTDEQGGGYTKWPVTWKQFAEAMAAM
ncbi:spherulation-specific family 4 [Pochonia chlamydosporia 170]|uniref:Spherulation-specific family 4 n=1 Tax=Pochonia chlamydosporia 170 TaxID=1380566 RepID=A0A179EYW1_METCM|nr:spherulation-specific family 4 [Pochonia chlamydosporia 170]OAQ58358.1 spherulation-specific family 4 [Pochonia chlamydosporia 170]